MITALFQTAKSKLVSRGFMRMNAEPRLFACIRGLVFNRILLLYPLAVLANRQVWRHVIDELQRVSLPF